MGMRYDAASRRAFLVMTNAAQLCVIGIYDVSKEQTEGVRVALLGGAPGISISDVITAACSITGREINLDPARVNGGVQVQESPTGELVVLVDGVEKARHTQHKEALADMLVWMQSRSMGEDGGNA